MDINLRPVMETDFSRIYELRNHPEVRGGMFKDKNITWEEHLAFWKERMSDKRAASFMVVCDGNDIGFARLDRRDGFEEAGIIIDPEWQGKGAGTKALACLAKVAKERGTKKLGARVKPENAASKKAFERNGFLEKYTYYELEL